ncbi:proton myo-inositol cotransporter-like isoform X2 [Lineus longissimus]|uniref:proton myo-inositol cotransporter-like isoform X2 n=1 Tax=Lineus longissimus TaxID=88925 RepID=UPI00315D7F24
MEQGNFSDSSTDENAAKKSDKVPLLKSNGKDDEQSPPLNVQPGYAAINDVGDGEKQDSIPSVVHPDDPGPGGGAPVWDKSQDHQSPPGFIYVLAFFASIGGFLFGYDTGVISGAMIFLKQEFNLDSLWQELIVSVTIGAAAIFAIAGGVLNNYFGRKPTTLAASFIFTVGSIVLAVSYNRFMLLAGRLIVGAGIGLASMTVPMYIAETSPAEIRGRMVTLYNLFVTGGQFIASVVDGLFSRDPENGWRYMLGLAAVPAFVQFIGFWFMPESPRWLVSKEKHDDARKVLRTIVNEGNVNYELQSIQQSFIETRREREQMGKSHIAVHMWRDKAVRRALILGCGLQMFQQIGGINTVMYYSASIVKMSGVKSDEMAVWYAALTAAVNFLFTFVGLYLVEKIGRRPLTLASQAGVVIGLVVLAVGFQFAAFHAPDIDYHDPVAAGSVCDNYKNCDPCISSLSCGYCYLDTSTGPANGSCLPVMSDDMTMSAAGRCNHTSLPTPLTWAYEYCPTPYSWMAIFGLVLYLMFFAPGMGPMPWTINSEIYPLWARSAGASAATATNWIFNLLISMTFLTLTETITKYGTFWLYTVFSMIGLTFMVILVPETQGVPLEDIQELFRQPILRKLNKVT